eukprot:3664540-Pleurochrysis_carterae.AAC.2
MRNEGQKEMRNDCGAALSSSGFTDAYEDQGAKVKESRVLGARKRSGRVHVVCVRARAQRAIAAWPWRSESGDSRGGLAWAQASLAAATHASCTRARTRLHGGAPPTCARRPSGSCRRRTRGRPSSPSSSPSARRAAQPRSSGWQGRRLRR